MLYSISTYNFWRHFKTSATGCAAKAYSIQARSAGQQLVFRSHRCIVSFLRCKHQASRMLHIASPMASYRIEFERRFVQFTRP
ncbi:hypothetical protein ABKN59_005532 [Abortiporus biennis]